MTSSRYSMTSHPQIETSLESAVSRAARKLLSSNHGEGCNSNSHIFYTLDSVMWADMATRFVRKKPHPPSYIAT